MVNYFSKAKLGYLKMYSGERHAQNMCYDHKMCFKVCLFRKSAYQKYAQISMWEIVSQPNWKEEDVGNAYLLFKADGQVTPSVRQSGHRQLYPSSFVSNSAGTFMEKIKCHRALFVYAVHAHVCVSVCVQFPLAHNAQPPRNPVPWKW